MAVDWTRRGEAQSITVSESEAPEPRTVADVIDRLETIADQLEANDARRHFHLVYVRSTRGVQGELKKGGFVDPDWLQALDVVFAGLYLDAFDAWDRGQAPTAWQIPFAAARDKPGLPPLRHILFAMNVHVNFDLPQALIATITDEELDDAAVVAKREQDHVHINDVLGARVAAEDKLLPGRTLSDRLMAPLNRRATKKFLAEARDKVWRNARVLSKARRMGPDRLAARVVDLDRLCAARAQDLVAPGRIILKLARRGFGVLLPDA
jgi:hypothetical protein